MKVTAVVSPGKAALTGDYRKVSWVLAVSRGIHKTPSWVVARYSNAWPGINPCPGASHRHARATGCGRCSAQRNSGLPA